MDGNFAVKTPIDNPAASGPKANLRERVESLRLPDESQLRGSGMRWLAWVLGVAVLAGGGFFAHRTWFQGERQVADATNSTTGSGNSASSATNSPSATPSAMRSTAAASPADSTASIASSGEIAHESKGYVVPAHQILVSPKVPGMITMLRIEEGQRVQKDDVLAQLETTDYDADYSRAKA